MRCGRECVNNLSAPFRTWTRPRYGNLDSIRHDVLSREIVQRGAGDLEHRMRVFGVRPTSAFPCPLAESAGSNLSQRGFNSKRSPLPGSPRTCNLRSCLWWHQQIAQRFHWAGERLHGVKPAQKWGHAEIAASVLLSSTIQKSSATRIQRPRLVGLRLMNRTVAHAVPRLHHRANRASYPRPRLSRPCASEHPRSQGRVSKAQPRDRP
jgi:hypothetical protein